jgi:NodT family efflux transporter outer membrane factor (OMF) lipoprotein
MLLLLSACAVGPDYQRPLVPVPSAFKEAGWSPGVPADGAERGAWWLIYGDPTLDVLERQVDLSNQNLKAAEAAYTQAAALVRAARAGLFPTLNANAFVERQGNGGGSSHIRSGGGGAKTSSTITQFDLGGTLSWELDVWGRIRRTVEANEASAQASAGDLASARLSAQATLAIDYLELRIADELKRLLDSAAAAYAQSLQITRNQYAAGVAARSDVAQAETQLKTTQAQAINVGVQRAQLEHAIAILIGMAPADFSIAPVRLAAEVPPIPAGVPSALLQRRPDIAAAERRAAAANAQIGVALAAYYPDLTLNGSLTYASTAFAGLLGTSNRVWALGPQLAQTLFNGGLTEAQVDEARAVWEQSAATYRQTVLTAFQQVEDQLSTLRVLETQAAIQAEAVASAHEAERLFLNQYKAGTVAYTSVVTAQTAALSNEQTALTVFENRLTASVALIQALGGGWDTSQTPKGE